MRALKRKKKNFSSSTCVRFRERLKILRFNKLDFISSGIQSSTLLKKSKTEKKYIIVVNLLGKKINEREIILKINYFQQIL